MTPERLTELRAWFAEGHELKSRRYGAELLEEVDRLNAQLEIYQRLYSKAIDCVDRVFQTGAHEEPPLLPDFLLLGDDKFTGVVKLAEDYLRLRAALELIAQVRHVSGSAQGAFRSNLKIADAALAGKDLRSVEAVEEVMNP